MAYCHLCRIHNKAFPKQGGVFQRKKKFMERIKSNNETSSDNSQDVLTNTLEAERPTVCLDSLVTYRYIEDGEIEKIYLNKEFAGRLSDTVADAKNIQRGTMAISDQSPIGSSIKGKEIGQEISIKAPGGEFTIIIEDIQKI